MLKRLTKIIGLMIVILILSAVIKMPFNLALAAESSLWTGNIFPVGGSKNETSNAQPFDIYIQAYKNGITNQSGQGDNITCALYWSEVDNAGNWKNPLNTSMSYSGDRGNNDEYQVTIFPNPGNYEFTANCTDLAEGTTIWQQTSNGKLKINSERRAFWVNRNIITWNSLGAKTYELHYDKTGNLQIPKKKGSGIELNFDGQVKAGEYDKFPKMGEDDPQWGTYDKWRIPDNLLSEVPNILQSEIAIAAYDESDNLSDVSGIQIQGVLDDLYRYSGDLGVIYNRQIPELKLWAPTAQSVSLERFSTPNSAAVLQEESMSFNPQTGVWSIQGEPNWDRQYYRYKVAVYVPETGKIEQNFVSDPYAVNLSENSQQSQFIDLNDDNLKPAGWDTLEKPTFTVPEDISIYEIHLRDFSRDDLTIPAEHRGKFKAFIYDGQNDRTLSDGMKHLINLAQAGLSHVHFLPVFDLASIEENSTQREDPDYSILAQYSPDSEKQQEYITKTKDKDSFNWGYDPYHYGVPEGSYATEPNNTSRILEFREMVQTLNQNGLRVVMDVVYNHTSASGQNETSVLDKIVPGYYHRYNSSGDLLTTSCCADTASEFDMMEKLMIDTIVRWAKAYKVDSFRFDLMNLHTVDNIKAVNNALNQLTVTEDGVDGSAIYLYGEGWDFGSAKDKGLRYAKQLNMAGTGIGTFIRRRRRR